MKFRFDKVGDPCENGSVPVFAIWAGGPTLAGVRNCPVDGFPDLKRRTAYVSGDPLTWFSMPASIRYRGKRVTGFLARRQAPEFTEGYVFVPNVDERDKLRDD